MFLEDAEGSPRVHNWCFFSFDIIYLRRELQLVPYNLTRAHPFFGAGAGSPHAHNWCFLFGPIHLRREPQPVLYNLTRAHPPLVASTTRRP